jgi:hypothetical protein
MRKVDWFVYLWFLILGSSLQAQMINTEKPVQEILIQIQPIISDQMAVLQKNYYVEELKDSVSLDHLRFYVSNISFLKNGKVYKLEGQRYFLIDLEHSESWVLSLKVKGLERPDSLRFNIGVDSAMQVKGAQGGDLDPMHGMYWSWRSGYVNFKCEGKSKRCPGEKNAFVFHIGGYRAPFNTIQRVMLPVKEGPLMVQMDLTPLFSEKNILENFKVMSPNKAALDIANQLPNLFQHQP